MHRNHGDLNKPDEMESLDFAESGRVSAEVGREGGAVVVVVNMVGSGVSLGLPESSGVITRGDVAISTTWQKGGGEYYIGHGLES